ncbi:hypothetical protein TWF481_010299 [Arthrobotrys musiformis]|uniref:Uncharacterized protein n=1 Tax=Arthrobotrys musiformis TaxID=47236 RepID=A0AAV9W2R6_9PEZI
MLPRANLRDVGWGDHRVQNFMHTQRGYKLNIKEEMDTLIQLSLIPRATAGGLVRMRIHQVNEDGAGPFKCKLDQTGTADNFGAWQTLSRNIAGNAHSLNKGTIRSGNNWLEMPLPKDLKCTGTYGNYKNVCMIRCENQAVNGPFGGCVPFQQVLPEPEPEAPEPETPEPEAPEPEAPEPEAPEPEAPKPTASKPSQKPPYTKPARPPAPKPVTSVVVSVSVKFKTIYKPAPTVAHPRPSNSRKPTPKGDDKGGYSKEEIAYY